MGAANSSDTFSALVPCGRANADGRCVAQDSCAPAHCLLRTSERQTSCSSVLASLRELGQLFVALSVTMVTLVEMVGRTIG